jgi:hypothetical protein
MKKTLFPASHWHQLFATVLAEWLKPHQTSATLISQHSDLNLLLLSTANTPSIALPDGLNQSQQKHLLIAIKYTQTFDTEDINQLMAYNPPQELTNTSEPIGRFLISNQANPEIPTIPTPQQGIYQLESTDIKWLMINEMSFELQNTPLKCFSNQQQQLRKIYPAVCHLTYSKLSIIYWFTRYLLWKK